MLCRAAVISRRFALRKKDFLESIKPQLERHEWNTGRTKHHKLSFKIFSNANKVCVLNHNWHIRFSFKQRWKIICITNKYSTFLHSFPLRYRKSGKCTSFYKKIQHLIVFRKRVTWIFLERWLLFEVQSFFGDYNRYFVRWHGKGKQILNPT